MAIPEYFKNFGCERCDGGYGLGFDFTMAFQPIVDFNQRAVFGYEALVRGSNNESAAFVLSRVNSDNLYKFDQACRIKAIELAAKLGIKSFLSINFLPNAVYEPELCIRTTLQAAKIYGFPTDKIIFEITEVEEVKDTKKIKDIVEYYKKLNFLTAIDDFGSGYAGLNLLADFQPNFIKLDMLLIRGIDNSRAKQSIVKGMVEICKELNVSLLAEGVETYEELQCLRDLNINYFQGYYFARPLFEGIADVTDDKFSI